MLVHIGSTAAFNKLIRAGGVVVVDFFATWCGPCKVIAPKFEKLSQQFEAATFAKVDVDELGEVAQVAEVTAMPTFKIYKDGVVVSTIIGADAKKLEAAVNEHCA